MCQLYFTLPDHKYTAITFVFYLKYPLEADHAVGRYERDRAAELAAKRERARFGRRRVYVRASTDKQRARKAPSRGGRGGGHDNAGDGLLLDAAKGINDAGFKPSY